MPDWFIWNEVTTNPAPFTGEIDIRREVATILDNRGHYVFLRKARKKHAPTWDSARSEARESDPFNLGNGLLYDDYLCLSRKVPTVAAQSGVEREIRTEIGYLTSRRYVFYFKHDVIAGIEGLKPEVTDQIVEVTLDEDSRLPKLAYNIERIYDIEYTHDYRDQLGRIEYWSVIAQQRVLGK